MEEINFEISPKVDQTYINKLYEQEKYERLANNKKKCLEISLKIVIYYLCFLFSIKKLNKFLEIKDYSGYFTAMKNLHKKKEQSGYVIYNLIKSSIMILEKIHNDTFLLDKYFEVIKSMLENLKLLDEKNFKFEESKNKLVNLIDNKNYEIFIENINNFNFDPDDIVNEKKTLKKLSLGESSDFNNTDSSTKIEKLEISIHKDYVSSTRNFNLISHYEKSDKSNINNFDINLDIKSDHMNYSIINKTKLPHLKIGVVITLSSLEIKRIFIDEMRNYKAIIKGDENSDVIQADKRDFNLFRTILDCFSISRKTQSINSIHFTIKYSENFHERIIDIKAINGKREICEEMILSFIAVLAKKLVKVRKIKAQAVNIDKILKEHIQDERRKISNIYGMGSPFNYESLKDEDNSIIDFTNKEATNFYELYRILSQENYELGKSVSDFVENFKNNNTNIEESSKNIPKQMQNILKFIDSCVGTFFCYFNYGKSNTEKMLPYVRPAVENIIFKKLSDVVYETYNYKYFEENKKFIASQKSIRENMTTEEIMDYLEINKKFRVFEKRGIPFKSTIDYLNKIEYDHTPKDKFETLMRANLELRNCILDITRGKVFYFIKNLNLV